jgi:hypothetical protein
MGQIQINKSLTGLKNIVFSHLSYSILVIFILFFTNQLCFRFLAIKIGLIAINRIINS